MRKECQKIYVLGAADSSVIRLIRDINQANGTDLNILGFIDRNWRELAETFHDIPILRKDPDPKMPGSDGIRLANSIASSMSEREDVTFFWEKDGWRFANLVHPSVNMEMVELGEGNPILEGFLGPGTRLGSHNVIRASGFVGHDSIVGDYCFIGPNVSLCGDTRLGSGTFIGAGATVLPHLSIGPGATVGAGAVVTRDVLPGDTVVGVPAKSIGEGD